MGWLVARLWERLSSRLVVMAVVITTITVGLLPAWNVHLVPDSVRRLFHFRYLSPFRTEYEMWRVEPNFFTDRKEEALALKAIGKSHEYFDLTGMVRWCRTFATSRSQRSRRFAESGAKADGGSHGIDDRAPSRISFLRYKRTLGNSLRPRGYESRKREARIGCHVLNRMAELGKPESQAIGGELSWAAKRCRARTNGLMHQRRAARPSAAQAIGLDWRGPNQMSNVSQAEWTNTLAPPPWIS